MNFAFDSGKPTEQHTSFSKLVNDDHTITTAMSNAKVFLLFLATLMMFPVRLESVETEPRPPRPGRTAIDDLFFDGVKGLTDMVGKFPKKVFDHLPFPGGEATFTNEFSGPFLPERSSVYEAPVKKLLSKRSLSQEFLTDKSLKLVKRGIAGFDSLPEFFGKVFPFPGTDKKAKEDEGLLGYPGGVAGIAPPPFRAIGGGPVFGPNPFRGTVPISQAAPGTIPFFDERTAVPARFFDDVSPPHQARATLPVSDNF